MKPEGCGAERPKSIWQLTNASREWPRSQSVATTTTTPIKMGKTEDGEKKKLTKEEKEVRCDPSLNRPRNSDSAVPPPQF